MDKVHSEERRFTPEGIEIDIGRMVLVCVSVCLWVCPRTFVNSFGSAKLIRTGQTPFDAPKRRNDDGVGHVAPSGTWHVPRAAAWTQHELDTFFEGTIAETWNLQGICSLVWRMCHVSDDPVGSKLCPQGSIPFFSLMPSSSDSLWRNFTKFGTGGQFNRGFQKLQNLGGSKN